MIKFFTSERRLAAGAVLYVVTVSCEMNGNLKYELASANRVRERHPSPLNAIVRELAQPMLRPPGREDVKKGDQNVG